MQKLSDFEKACTLYNQGKHELAEDFFLKILKIDPKNSPSFYYLSIIKSQSGKYQEAIELINKAIIINPIESRYYVQLADIHYNLNNLEVAVTFYEKSIAINPNYFLVYFHLGLTFVKLNQLENAAVNFKKCIAINPNFSLVHHNLGILQKNNNQLKEALASFDKAIANDQNFVAAYKSRIFLKSALGLFQGAIRDASKLAKISISRADDAEEISTTLVHCIVFDLISRFSFNQIKSHPVRRDSSVLVDSKKKIDIVTFFVPPKIEGEIEKLSSKKTSWNFFLNTFFQNAKRLAPDARVILLTTSSTELPIDIPPYYIFRVDVDSKDLMYARLMCQIKYIKSRPENIGSFILDLDILINKIPWDLVESEFDVALTTRNYLPALNAGVMYLNSGERSRYFLDSVLKYYNELLRLAPTTNGLKNTNFKKWWGDQIAMCGAAGILNASMLVPHEYSLGNINFKLLDCERYNNSTAEINEGLLSLDLSEKFFLHFKGNINSQEMEILEQLAFKLQKSNNE